MFPFLLINILLELFLAIAIQPLPSICPLVKDEYDPTPTNTPNFDFTKALDFVFTKNLTVPPLLIASAVFCAVAILAAVGFTGVTTLGCIGVVDLGLFAATIGLLVVTTGDFSVVSGA